MAKAAALRVGVTRGTPAASHPRVTMAGVTPPGNCRISRELLGDRNGSFKRIPYGRLILIEVIDIDLY